MTLSLFVQAEPSRAEPSQQQKTEGAAPGSRKPPQKNTMIASSFLSSCKHHTAAGRPIDRPTYPQIIQYKCKYKIFWLVIIVLTQAAAAVGRRSVPIVCLLFCALALA